MKDRNEREEKDFWLSELVVDEAVRGPSCNLIKMDVWECRQADPQRIKPDVSSESCTCSVTFYILPCSYQQECASNYTSSLLFSVHMCLIQTTQRDPRTNLLRGEERIASPWKKHGLKTCLHAFLWVVRVCSWKEAMSAIHTWACFLLWVSFATQDKTPGKTQALLCPRNWSVSRESFTRIKRLKETDTQIKFVKRTQ